MIISCVMIFLKLKKKDFVATYTVRELKVLKLRVNFKKYSLSRLLLLHEAYSVAIACSD